MLTTLKELLRHTCDGGIHFRCIVLDRGRWKCVVTSVVPGNLVFGQILTISIHMRRCFIRGSTDLLSIVDITVHTLRGHALRIQTLTRLCHDDRN